MDGRRRQENSELPPSKGAAFLDSADVRRSSGAETLFPLVYGELRRIAHRRLAAEPSGHTLSTTALVHETYLRLVDQESMIGADRAQFFAVAAQAMRRILIDYARRHRALRRGGARQRVSLEMLDSTGADVLQAPQLVATDRAEELLALDEALERLATVHDRLCRVVELRFFAGLTEAETAEVLGVTSRTVTRDWVKARAWLFRALQDGHSNVT